MSYKCPFIGSYAAGVAAMLAFGSVLTPRLCWAESATWKPTPADGNWNNPSNWISEIPPPSPTIPQNPTDTAFFGGTTQRELTLTSSIVLAGITFRATAPSLAISLGENTIRISGSGITNSSSLSQNIILDHEDGRLEFHNFSSAGVNVTVANSSGDVVFLEQSTAAGATINSAGLISFQNSTRAGNSRLFNEGEISFVDGANAENAVITNTETSFLGFFTESSAGSSQIRNEEFGTVLFQDTSKGGTSVISNLGELQFVNFASAENAVITNEGAGTLEFFEASSAGSATILTKAGAFTGFSDTSSAGTITVGGTTLGTARFITEEGGVFDISGLTTAGFFASSIAGAGDYFLGSRNLTIGNNLEDDTVVTGMLSDGGEIEEEGGSLTKVGASRLTLSGENTYSGGTFLNGGVLAIFDDVNLGSEEGPLSFNGGTLQTMAAIFSSRDITLESSGGTFDSNGFDSTLESSITGAGGLTKIGLGVLTLNGGSDYTGPTAVLAGTLQAGPDGALSELSAFTIAAGAKLDLNDTEQSVGSIAGAGSITLGIGMLTTGADNTSTTFSGVISGTGLEGGVTKVGLGTWTISGTNVYEGHTNIDEGILQAGAVNTLPLKSAVTIEADALLDLNNFSQSIGSLAGDGNVTLGSAILTTGSDNSDTLYAGVIDGTGRLIKVGSGTFTLEGENTHTGGTVVRRGTLEISSDSNLGAETGLLVLDTDLAIPGIPLSTLRTLEGIDSSRPVVLEGRGGSFDSLGNDSILRGSITGPGGLTKMSLGRLILAGTNRYTGGTTISGGILQIGAGGVTGSVAGNITNNAALVFNRANSLTFPGVIRGSGTVTQAGSGRTILTGVNTYTGSTFIRRGELDVDGSTASANTFVFPGGTLGGTGTLLGNVFNSGVVSPGHSPGTLHIGGNYTQNVHGTLRIEVASRSNFDRLLVGKHAKLDGTMQLLSLGNFTVQRGDRLTFLTAGKISGTFADIQGLDQFSPAGTIISAGVIYTGTTVSLEAIQGSFAALPSLTRNQQAVARNLDKIVLDPRSDKLIDFLDREFLGNLPRDFDLIAPEELASIFEISFSLANVQNANLQRRTDDIRSGSSGFSAAGFAMAGSGPSYSGRLAGVGEADSKSDKNEKSVIEPSRDNPWGVFITGTGEFVDVGNTDNARGYDITTGGVTLGLDYRATPHLAFGISAGYAGTGADLADGGRVSVNGGKLGLYGTCFTGGFYLDGAVGGGYNSYDTKRTALHGSARGQTEGLELNALLGTGYDWRAGGLKIGPTATIQYSQVGINEFQERHSLAPLTIADQHRESLRSSLGLRASYDFKLNDHVLILPEVRAAWQHELGDREYAIDSRLANGAGSIFTVDGPRMGRDSLLVSAGVAVQWSDRVSTYLSYDGQVARTNYQSHSFSGGVRVAF